MHEIPVVEYIPIPPDAGKVTDALSRIGYKIEEALADIVDNSIDAAASNVLIRIVHNGADISRIVIADDGVGMSRDALISAMQFGATRTRNEVELGKFGMGLKTAAFSQGRSLTVISRKANKTNACRWTTESIEEGWQCEVLDANQASRKLDEIQGPFSIKASGTLIIIDELDHLRVSEKGLESTLQKIQKSLSVHLGLVFHRFITCGLEIFLDSAAQDDGAGGFAIPVSGLDPFSYVVPGDPNYPIEFAIQIRDLPPLRCVAHIWPANQNAPGYVLGGGNVAKRQGFYFYRNGRLIQAGGWNGWRIAESEPHMSLARVMVELRPEFDSQFRLNVQKSSVDVPEEFRSSLNDRKSPMGKFVRRSDEIYRNKSVVEETFMPVPGRGFDGKIRRRATTFLAGNKFPSKDVNVVWKRLSLDRFFEIDRATGTIYLNAIYRQDILRGQSSTLNDAPLVKTFLFLLLREELMRSRVSRQSIERIEQFNEMLMLALAEEQGRQ